MTQIAFDAYCSLFGASTRNQVAWRISVDLIVANVALIAGIVLRELYVGGLSQETTVTAFTGFVAASYAVNAPAMTLLVAVLFIGASIYRPLPSSRLSERAFHIGLACICGALIHLGVTVLFQGSPSRAIVIPAWTALGLMAVSVRFARIGFTSRYHLKPRMSSKQHRVEDVLVVGGAGYIGSVLTRQLLDAGYRVRVLDLQLFGSESLEGVIHNPRLDVQVGDFRNVEHVVRALRGMDAVVHLGAIVGDPACAVDADATIAVNYEAAKMLATLTRANGISRLVFASTCSVYGESDQVIDEKSDLNPVSLYATTKIDAERALLDSVDDVFQPTILRLSTAYGWSHRPRFDLVANLLSAKAVTDKDITVFNGEQWRPFVNTHDISRSIIAALEAPLESVGGEIFNVGDNAQNYTISQLGKIVADAVPGTVVNEVRNDEDPRNYRVCFDKIQRVLGFRSVMTLEDGIQEIVNAVQGGKVEDWKDPKYSNLRQMEGAVNVLRFKQPEAAEPRELEATKQFLRRAA